MPANDSQKAQHSVENSNMGICNLSKLRFQFRSCMHLPHNTLDSLSDFEHPVLVINQRAPDTIL